ncbi:MAG: hypothetical protein E6K69_02440 [Nitrospirae bacterium]|nr:MAG: hypothetical protein E6K69_02440 [Nitrospirota bacterium]
MRHLGLEVEKASVVIQGFGNVGSHTARIMQEHGLRVIAVSDKSGGLYNPKGLDIPELLKRYRADGHRKFRDIKIGD